jgi:uncharacterized protein involved in exopolysaccharide biosynthesis
MLRLKDGGIGIAAQLYIPSEPVKPNKMLNITLAGAASLFVGIFMAFFMEYIKKIN